MTWDKEGTQLAKIIYDYYLANGNAGTVAELAEFSKLSQATIRKALDACYGCPHDSDIIVKEVPVREKNYNTVKCYRRVNAFVPSLKMLRAAILEAENTIRVHEDTIGTYEAEEYDRQMDAKFNDTYGD